VTRFANCPAANNPGDEKKESERNRIFTTQTAGSGVPELVMGKLPMDRAEAQPGSKNKKLSQEGRFCGPPGQSP